MVCLCARLNNRQHPTGSDSLAASEEKARAGWGNHLLRFRNREADLIKVLSNTIAEHLEPMAAPIWPGEFDS